MNFQHGTDLANYQDALFKEISNGATISTSVLKQLTTNKWISLSTYLAPSNLTVRQYCLIDIVCHHFFNINNILSNLSNLVYFSKNLKYLLWVEGYSYWLYTKPFLEMYLEKVKLPDEIFQKLTSFMNDVDLGFSVTAYKKNDGIYPVTFGDLRYIKLVNQTDLIKDEISIGPILKHGSMYYINKQPVGFNLHTNNSEFIVDIHNDKAYVINSDKEIEYKFYESYEKKYPTFLSELNEMITCRRVLSIWLLMLKRVRGDCLWKN